MASKSSSAPASVAEGLGNVLRAISDTLQAPDATQFAGPLLKLQTSVLDMVHGQMKGGQQAPGAPAQGQPPMGGGSPAMGGLAGLMGAGQGPSAATSGSGPSPSGMDPEQMRQMAMIGGGDAS